MSAGCCYLRLVNDQQYSQFRVHGVAFCSIDSLWKHFSPLTSPLRYRWENHLTIYHLESTGLMNLYTSLAQWTQATLFLLISRRNCQVMKNWSNNSSERERNRKFKAISRWQMKNISGTINGTDITPFGWEINDIFVCYSQRLLFFLFFVCFTFIFIITSHSQKERGREALCVNKLPLFHSQATCSELDELIHFDSTCVRVDGEACFYSSSHSRYIFIFN